jgi:Carbohydrate esterase, sialic acid-specific acetylesterase
MRPLTESMTRSLLCLALLGLLAAPSSCASSNESGTSGSGGIPIGGGGNAGAGNAGAGSAGAASAGSSSVGGSGNAGAPPGTAGASAGGETAGAAGKGSSGSTAGGASGSGSNTGGTGGAATGGASGAGTAGAASSDPNAIDVYFIGGQSNATGQGYTKNYPAGFSIDTQVQLYHSSEIKSTTAGNVWSPLRHASEAADGCGDRFGPELGFGNNIQAAYPGRRIAIIKHAKSSTNLANQWAPGSSGMDTAHFGPEFKTFVATVDGGLKALRDKGMTPIIRGMLWQQGENDADLGGTASSDYGQHLSAFIARVRQQWSAPDMLFVYGYVYPKSNYGTGRDQVRKAEADVDQNSGNALAVKGAFVVLTDDLELRANDPNSCYKSDLIHFGTAGQLDLGKRMATKMHDQLALLPH